MRFLSYNIHKGIGGLDRRYALSRIIKVIEGYDPDVLVLQEVDCGARRSRFHDQAALLAKRLGYAHFAYCLNHSLRKGGGYGNATLSKWPLHRVEHWDISLPLKKRRGALYTEIETPSLGIIHVCNLHLGLAGFERSRQVKKVLDLTHEIVCEKAPLVLAGDFNDWPGRLSGKLERCYQLREAGVVCTGRHQATFPALKPFLALDRIYFRGLEPLSNQESRDLPASFASDHRPLSVQFSGLSSQLLP